jgi:hypothetical protein
MIVQTKPNKNIIANKKIMHDEICFRNETINSKGNNPHNLINPAVSNHWEGFIMVLIQSVFSYIYLIPNAISGMETQKLTHAMNMVRKSQHPSTFTSELILGGCRL